MALFTLTDIKIKPQEKRRSVGGASLVGSKYDRDTYRYPIDLGSVDKAHYMVIHINKQRRTRFESPSYEDELTTANANRAGLDAFNGGPSSVVSTAQQAVSDLSNSTTVQRTAEQAKQKVNDTVAARNAASSGVVQSLTGVASGINEILTESKDLFLKSGVRTTVRTADTIALYMPDTLAFTQSQNYANLELGGDTAALVAAGYSGVSKMIDSGMTARGELEKWGVKNATPFVAAQLAKSSPTLQAIFSGATGTTINPQLEIIYSSPTPRNFRFDFMFYPRSSVEAQEVQNIIQKLRFHQAPEVLGSKSPGSGGLGGFFLVPPSEFDISFYYNGVENPNIPKVSTCVLTTLDVDYAPNGFHTYERMKDNNFPELGGTGMPVAIRLGLNFQETQIMTKYDLM